jgi:glycosyltransferase involved in cell wall biosynthesis
VKFVWIGAAFSQAYMDEILYEQEKRGLAHSVHFIGPRVNPSDYFSIFDTFFLPSREDPFPLVMLIAAQHKLPIVCFDNAGGAPEFVQKDAGYSVPFGDTEAAAQAIRKLYFDATDRALRGIAAHNRLISNHDISVVGPQILATINNTLQTTL